jgi:hypothetical protein
MHRDRSRALSEMGSQRLRWVSQQWPPTPDNPKVGSLVVFRGEGAPANGLCSPIEIAGEVLEPVWRRNEPQKEETE